MTLKLSTWLLVALAGGALLAGCGSSSNSTSSSQTTSTATVAPGSTTTSGTTTTTLPLTPAQAKQAVETCKHGVQAQSAIPSSAKSKLEKTCEKAGAGDTTAIRQVAEEACVLLVNASHIPAGAARERALAICKANTK